MSPVVLLVVRPSVLIYSIRVVRDKRFPLLAYDGLRCLQLRLNLTSDLA